MQSPTKDKVAEEMHQVTAPLQDKLEFIKNPVVAEFLGLAQNSDFTESDLEGNIISHLQKFIMELGKGFAFVARQKHIRTDMGENVKRKVDANCICQVDKVLAPKSNE